MHAAIPLSLPEKLCNPEFPVPLCFIYGENDWTRVVDKDIAKKCVDSNLWKWPTESMFYLVPDSDHYMMIDNP